MGRRSRDQFEGRNRNGMPPHAVDKIAAIPQGGILLNAPPEMPPPVVIEGFTFNGPPMVTVADIFLINMVFQARRGDKTCDELLTAWRIRLMDNNGQQVWPVLVDEEVKTESGPVGAD